MSIISLLNFNKVILLIKLNSGEGKLSKTISRRESLHRQASKLQAENKKLLEQITQLRSLANLGLVFSMACHEINNVLTPIGNYAQLALDNPDDIELTKKVQKKTVNNCYRAQKILQNLLNSANRNNTEKALHNFQNLFDNVIDCISRDFSKDRIKFEIDIESDLEIYAIDVDIEQLLMNLILNARDAMMETGGTLSVKAYENGGNVFIEVSDSGGGISKQEMKNIFEPFYSTKKDDNSMLGGCGLGLTFCKQIVDSYDGSITIESDEDSGTIFKIGIPKNPPIC